MQSFNFDRRISSNARHQATAPPAVYGSITVTKRSTSQILVNFQSITNRYFPSCASSPYSLPSVFPSRRPPPSSLPPGLSSQWDTFYRPLYSCQPSSSFPDIGQTCTWRKHGRTGSSRYTFDGCSDDGVCLVHSSYHSWKI